MTVFDQILRLLDHYNVSLTTVTSTVVLLLAASFVVVLINRVIRGWLRLLEGRISLPYQTVLAVTRAISTLLWVITVLILLDIWGVGLTGIWTLLVSAATVVGVGFLATWAMVSNFTASFFITLWRPFQLGDMVQVLPEAMRGRVIDRNLMFTTLREDDGSILQIPNNLFFQKIFRVLDRNDRFLFEELGALDRARNNVVPPPK
ncbi:MAG TPA: mechanosensitive ion channel family protein [Xanthobacteraceae bacterium]|nr:mechanosensitive ion channel family protein [Xanthobacteraceae bacterium]